MVIIEKYVQKLFLIALKECPDALNTMQKIPALYNKSRKTFEKMAFKKKRHF